jgi:hypothetical protein
MLDTVSLIALEAYDYLCHSRVEYYMYCICVGYSKHYVFCMSDFNGVGSNASRILLQCVYVH